MRGRERKCAGAEDEELTGFRGRKSARVGGVKVDLHCIVVVTVW